MTAEFRIQDFQNPCYQRCCEGNDVRGCSFEGRGSMPRQNTKDFGRILKCPLRPHHRFQNFRFPRATLQNPKVGSWTEGQIPESQYSAQYEEQNPVCKIQLLCGGIAVAEFENQISSAQISNGAHPDDQNPETGKCCNVLCKVGRIRKSLITESPIKMGLCMNENNTRYRLCM